jgi:hypothetical protein
LAEALQSGDANLIQGTAGGDKTLVNWPSILPRLVFGSFLAFVAIGLAAVHIASGLQDLGNDGVGYFDAGTRIREGAQLYLPAVGGDPDVVPYRYSPWFAWLWVPLTTLPRGPVVALWSLAMLAATAWALWPVARERTWSAIAVVAFFGPLMVYASLAGNVQPLMIAVLMHTVERRRMGPIAIALAASLKAFPALFAVVYLGQRDWRRFGLTAALTLILVAPMLLYDLSDYTTAPGFTITAAVWAPPLYAALALGAAVVAFLTAQTRYNWISAASTVVLAMTRLLWYDLTFLLVGLVKRQGRARTGGTVDPLHRAV